MAGNPGNGEIVKETPDQKKERELKEKQAKDLNKTDQFKDKD